MKKMHHHHDCCCDCLRETNRLLWLQIHQGSTQIEQNNHIIRLLRVLVIEEQPPYLASLQLLSKGIPMPTPGPITLVAAGETDQTIVVGLDQNGQPFTGPIPAGIYADDNAAAATTDQNGLVTAVANGSDNVSVSLTTAEGLALTASIQYIVDIPVAVPVLTSISLQSTRG